MEVRNCRNCGRIFNDISNQRLCPACRAEVEEKFQQVKEYIREFPLATISEVSAENDVSIQQINNWVREERLIFSPDSMVTIDCEKCGRPIRTGRYCDQCKSEMAHTLRSAYETKKTIVEDKKSTRESDRMRYLQTGGRDIK